MDYKITEFNSITGQITIYFIPLGQYISIDLPINSDRNVPVGIELSNYIKGFLPYGTIQRKAVLALGINNISEIANLIEAI